MNRETGVKNALDGTRTRENLLSAFEKEAENYAKSSLFASIAQNSGNISAKRTLLEHSDNDLRHAELWLGYLDELGDTAENIASLSARKEAMGEEIYPLMAETAREEGFGELAEKMRLAGDVKKAQSRALSDEKNKISSPELVYSENPETEWHCTSCGYRVLGNMPPESCPLCSYPHDFFQKAE